MCAYMFNALGGSADPYKTHNHIKQRCATNAQQSFYIESRI